MGGNPILASIWIGVSIRNQQLWVGYPPFSTGNHKKSHLFRLQDRQLLEKTHGMFFWAWIGTPKGISFKDNHGQPFKVCSHPGIYWYCTVDIVCDPHRPTRTKPLRSRPRRRYVAAQAKLLKASVAFAWERNGHHLERVCQYMPSDSEFGVSVCRSVEHGQLHTTTNSGWR